MNISVRVVTEHLDPSDVPAWVEALILQEYLYLIVASALIYDSGAQPYP